ncbi:MAG: recombinase family protein [Coraliomargaritaceae bacterium]
MNPSRKQSGKIPYGYQRNSHGALEVHPEESRVLKSLFEHFAQHRRKGTVARLLNESAYTTRKGAKWSDMAVGRILADPSYGKIAQSGDYPQIITLHLWEQVQDILTGQDSGTQRPGRAPKHLFAGKVKCHCGAMMYKPSNTPKYVCKTCRNKIPIEDLEKIYLKELEPFIAQAECSENLLTQWPELSQQDKHRIIDSTIDGVALKPGNAVEFIFSYSPFPKDVGNSQQWEKPTNNDTFAPQAAQTEAPAPTKPRQQLSTKEAASRLGYHPKTLLRKAPEWGLTKIYMSQTNVHFYEDEIEKLAKSRSYRG